MAEVKPSPIYDKISVGRDGSVIGKSGKMLSPMIDIHGYYRVSIYLGANRWKRVGVHRLVCETFHGLKPEWAHLVAHIDGNPSNNRADNLRWSTFIDNEVDKKRHGRNLVGERHHQAKLTEDQVRDIRRRRVLGETGKDLAVEFGVSQAAISCVFRRKSWGHI